MVKKYLIKKSQVVAIVVFLIEIMGAFILAQIDVSKNVLGKIGYVAIIYGVLSTIVLYQVKKEWDVFLIFMIMCYLFSFGQCILVAFGYELGVFAFSMDRGFFCCLAFTIRRIRRIFGIMVEIIFDVINTIVIVYNFADFLSVEVCRRTAISTG